MEFWHSAAFAEVDQLVDIGRTLEELGFAGITFSDHLFLPEELRSTYPYAPDGKPYWGPEVPWPDPWVAAAAIASCTQRLRFATQIFVLPMRNPFAVAKSVATLAVMSGDRVILGAGAGWMKEEFDQMGVDFATRGARFDEVIAVLRKLWAGGMVEHHGSHFSFDRLEMSPAPARPIPIYVGGHSSRALDRAARLGDGWLGGTYDLAEILESLAVLERLRKQHGRENEPFGAMAAMHPAPDLATCRRLEDAGLTMLVVAPWLSAQSAGHEAEHTGDRYDSFKAKRAAMEEFAESIITRM